VSARDDAGLAPPHIPAAKPDLMYSWLLRQSKKTVVAILLAWQTTGEQLSWKIERQYLEKTLIALIYLLTVKTPQRSIQRRVVKSGRKWVQPR
jgi:hypothetical protein